MFFLSLLKIKFWIKLTYFYYFEVFIIVVIHALRKVRHSSWCQFCRSQCRGKKLSNPEVFNLSHLHTFVDCTYTTCSYTHRTRTIINSHSVLSLKQKYRTDGKISWRMYFECSCGTVKIDIRRVTIFLHEPFDKNEKYSKFLYRKWSCFYEIEKEKEAKKTSSYKNLESLINFLFKVFWSK